MSRRAKTRKGKVLVAGGGRPARWLTQAEADRERDELVRHNDVAGKAAGPKHYISPTPTLAAARARSAGALRPPTLKGGQMKKTTPAGGSAGTRANGGAAARAAVDRAATRGLNTVDGESRAQYIARRWKESAIDAAQAGREFDRKLVDQEQAARARMAAESRATTVRVAALQGRSDIQLGREPSTYQRGGPHSFLRDALAAYMVRGGGQVAGLLSVECEARLARHQAETEAVAGRVVERAASSSANFAGLVVPQYMVDDVALLARAGRPFANICRHRDLPPDGMEVDVSRITTGASTGVQAAEGNAFGSTAIDDTKLTAPIATVGGFNDISFQAAMRSNAEDVLIEDAILDYHTKLDAAILVTGDGTNGTPVSVVNTPGIGTPTYLDATPTVPEAWSKLQGAAALVSVGVFKRATHFVMTPKRLEWFIAGGDAAGRPAIGEIGGPIPGYVHGVSDTGPTSQGNSGFQLGGRPVVTDPNIPQTLGAGTEDEIFAVAADELFLYEDPAMPMAVKFGQVAGSTGQIRIVVFGLFAFSAGRQPTASALLTGSGLIPPTF